MLAQCPARPAVLAAEEADGGPGGTSWAHAGGEHASIGDAWIAAVPCTALPLSLILGNPAPAGQPRHCPHTRTPRLPAQSRCLGPTSSDAGHASTMRGLRTARRRLQSGCAAGAAQVRAAGAWWGAGCIRGGLTALAWRCGGAAAGGAAPPGGAASLGWRRPPARPVAAAAGQPAHCLGPTVRVVQGLWRRGRACCAHTQPRRHRSGWTQAAAAAHAGEPPRGAG